MSAFVVMLWCFLTLVAAYVLKNYIKNRRFWHLVDKLNGDKTLPIIGNAHQFGTNSEDILKNTVRMWRDHGYGTYKIQLANDIFILICDPLHAEALLSSNHEIVKSYDYSFLANWLGDGLLLSRGEKWRRQRKIITPTFHFKILEQFIDVFNDKGDIFLKKLESGRGKVFDIYPTVSLYTLDVISESAMGVSINVQENGHSDYVRAVYSFCNILHHRTFSFWKRNNFLYSFSKDSRDEAKYIKVIHSVTDSVIATRRLQLKEQIEKEMKQNNTELDTNTLLGERKKLAFLDLLLLSKTTDGKPLSDDCIKDEVNTFMFEGHDTTSSAISFAMYCLANNQDVQARAAEEQRTIFAEDESPVVTYRHLQDMKYLELVIKETLRLYPSVPLYGRTLVNDMTLPDGKILPAGCNTTIHAFCLGRNPLFFDDAEKFIPERFLPENTRNRNSFLFVPFSAGPRNCIGQKFAMMEMKNVLSKVLRRYELISAGPGSEPILSAEITLKSKNGVLIQLKDREQ